MENTYEKIIERAKQAIIDCGSNAGRKEMIYDIFPELREWGEELAERAKDEKIKMTLIEYFRESHCDTIRGIGLQKIINWLERQKSVEWSKEDEEKLNYCIEACKFAHTYNGAEYGINWLKSLPERFK